MIHIKKEENYMPRGSKELTQSRKEEIINACAQLYETMNFKDITLKEIGKKTSFSRTSIYNYFQTKEEIFLALLQREYELWVKDLETMMQEHETMSAGLFADCLAHTLEKRERLLKIMSMNHYDLEENCRLENLTSFKVSYGNSMKTVRRCLEKYFPEMTRKDTQEFIYVFFPFLFGVYPYTVVSEKQREAMRLADADYVFLSIYEITNTMILKLLQGWQ